MSTAHHAVFVTPTYFHSDSYIGGGERYVTNVASGLVQSTSGSWSVEIISYGDRLRREQLLPNVTLRVLPALQLPESALSFDVLSWELPSALEDADIVHVYQPFARSSEVAILAAKALGKPVCVTDCGGHQSLAGYSIGMLDLADEIICLSEFATTLFSTTTPSTVILGGVDGAFFSPPADAPERSHILFAGRLLPHKGVDRLIAALPQETPLLICGPPYDSGYLQVLRRLAVGKPVEFIFDADDSLLRDLYQRSWATVLPSVHRDCFGNTYEAPELMGLTLLESMACGTPAIAPRVAAMPELIIEGKTGNVYDTLDELTSLLRDLAASPPTVTALGRAARASVEDKYDQRVTGWRFVEVYERLLKAQAG